MGSHPGASSEIEVAPGDRRLLTEYLASHPEALGEKARSLGAPGDVVPSLPFLFKILASAQPLSIQAHPMRKEARTGFEQEEAQGVPRDAPHRKYRDRNHKPELVCALGEFWGLCGFRPEKELVAEMKSLIRIFAAIDAHQAGAAIREYVAKPGDETWRRAFLSLMQSGRKTMQDAGFTAGLVDFVTSRAVARNHYWWVGELLRRYPRDIGVIAPLYLNLVRLDAGEAVFLESGMLHAYLQGAAVEIMANSDNVLRAGCTSKHVDIGELARVIRFERRGVTVSRGEKLDGQRQRLRRYATSAHEFELYHLSGPGRVYKRDGPAIILNLGVPITCEGLAVGRGRSVFVENTTASWSVTADTAGPISVYTAALPGAITAGGDLS